MSGTTIGDVTIRQMGTDELDLLMAWRMEVLHEVFDVPDDDPMEELEAANREYYARELPRGGHVACLAYVDGEAVACGGVCFYHEMPSPDNLTGACAYLMNIYTREGYRGRGIGGRVTRWLVGKARGRGITKIYLEASDVGYPLYRKLGFEDMPGYLRLPISEDLDDAGHAAPREID